jgi:uncharacterized protein involved in exopolysaccharide biosynthesis
MSEHGTAREADKDGGLDVIGTLRFLLSHRKWILACTLAFGLLGVAVALLSPSKYLSSATISLKERDAGEGASRFLSQFSAIGGTGTGNSSLEKVGIILQSYELAEEVVRDNNLLPRLFPKKWDAEAKRWKPRYAKKPPTVRDGARVLRGMITVKVNIRKDVIHVTLKTPAARRSRDFAHMYLTALRKRIRVNVLANATTERKYLEEQMANTLDPILREKIQNMIVFQIEKSMLVSAQAFEVLEGPQIPLQRAEPQRKRIVLMFLFAGFLSSIGGLYALRGYRILRTGLHEGAEKGYGA